jgi:sensor histidine kinase regulating citrate/malate metabolism
MFFLSNLSFLTSSSPFSSIYAAEVFYIRTLVDLCAIILLFAQQIQMVSLFTRAELNAMNRILAHQYDNYLQSKDNIETLNRHYHDLKHKIGVILAEDSQEKRNRYLKDIRTELKIFEAQNKTGNPVLDILLTGKSMYCARREINFTYVADGRLLDFMDAMDICSIVGNAMDNAIESVEKIADPEQRLIKMALYAHDDLLMLRFENYAENQSFTFENSLPKTTKNTHEGHGYGLRSIRYSAERYGGSLKVEVKDNWFGLYLLIPLKTSS